MNRDHRRAPRLESLEEKQLLSHAHVHVVPKVPAHAIPATQVFSLDGSLQMPVNSIATTTSTTGQTVGTFQVRGRLGSMGQVTGTFVAFLGPDGKSMTSGELRLSNRLGIVYLKMSYDPSNITAYNWTVDYGTDAFVAASGSGKMATAGVAAGGKTMLFNLTTN